MQRNLILITVIILIANYSYAASMEDIEEHFQKGLAYSRQDKIDEAIDEFTAIVSSEHKDLDQNYYEQTYAESYMNIGLLKSKQEQWLESIEFYKKALNILPDHKKTLYYLSYSFFAADEISEAVKHYHRAVALGFFSDSSEKDFVGEALDPFKMREVQYFYKPSLDSTQEITINIKGNPAGDDKLLYSVLKALEKLRKSESQAMLTNADISFIRRRENGEIFIEKWEVYENDDVTEYWIKYDLTPPEGFPDEVLIRISQEELE